MYEMFRFNCSKNKKKNRNNEENKKGIPEQNSAQNIKKYWNFDDWFYLLKKIFHW